MATHRIPMQLYPNPGHANAIYEPTALNFGANDRYPTWCWRFLDTATRDGIGFQVTIPKNYVGTPAFVLVSSATVTTGNLRLELDYRAIAKSGESLDPSTDQETLGLNQAAPGTARLGLESSLAATAANFAVDDVVLGTIVRDGAEGGGNADTIASDWYLFEAYLQYADA
ncbi:MAG: hypothetical protein ACREM3_18530 [Candidatus Rokuibacteriota bacterium]